MPEPELMKNIEVINLELLVDTVNSSQFLNTTKIHKCLPSNIGMIKHVDVEYYEHEDGALYKGKRYWFYLVIRYVDIDGKELEEKISLWKLYGTDAWEVLVKSGAIRTNI